MLYEAVGNHYNIVSLPLDSDTHRNLGYCFVKFESVDDLIRAYEHVVLLILSQDIDAGEIVALFRKLQDVSFLLCKDSKG